MLVRLLLDIGMRVLSPYVGLVIANPMQVRAIAHSRIKTDKIEAGFWRAAPCQRLFARVWVPNERTERLRRLASPRGATWSCGIAPV